jgi:chromosome partition protein MukB
VKRVRARNLVLVNWKGVFYERYGLDDNVTALEGDNGAGKTTVMVAAYIVLLPDMTRLSFTNVGESDATGGDRGVWGRLGNPNRPSYAVIQFDLGNEDVLAGVHLERKGEPSVELTPFLITGLPVDVRLQDALLLRSGEEEMVPELADLRENVAGLGGRLQVFRTAKDYFTALFDLGVTPLRLVTDEERSRFNEMLHTSMTGGISRALTSGFRSFLLKEESGLADTLARMRSNLHACRRTRIEVEEAQRLEQEISGVYEAAQEMLAAALLGVRRRAEELRLSWEKAVAERDEAQQAHDQVWRALSGRQEERAQVVGQLEKASEEHEAAAKMQAQVEAAHAIAKRLAEVDSELHTVLACLEKAASELKQAEDVRDERRAARTSCEENYRRAAQGLADFQEGLAELHRRADAYRRTVQRLEEARAALERPDLDADEAQEYAAAIEAEIAAVDKQRSELDAAIGGAEAHRREHSTALRALSLILRRDADANAAYKEAKAALHRIADLESLVGRTDTLQTDLRQARASLARQQEVRRAAGALATPAEPLTSAREVDEALNACNRAARAAAEQASQEEAKAEEIARRRQQLRTLASELQGRQARWRELDVVAQRLEVTLGAGLRSAAELEVARQILDSERDAVRTKRDMLEQQCSELEERAQQLELSGGVFPADLLAARDLVEGELLAGYFDDLEPEEAGLMQARLGPLAEAVVVVNARSAAATLAGHSTAPDTVWLVAEDALQDIMSAHANAVGGANGGAVIVEQQGVIRTTRVPAQPTLGRKARERLTAALREQAEKLRDEIAALDGQLAEIDSRRRDTALLTREVSTLEAGDPTPELARVTADLTEAAEQLESQCRRAEEARKQAERSARRADALRRLLLDAHLLDEPDLALKVAKLEQEYQQALQARKELARVATARKHLDEHCDALRRLPLTPDELAALHERLKQFNSRREQLFHAHDALRYVTVNRQALNWQDAEEELQKGSALVPALKTQCESAKKEWDAAIAAAEAAEAAWEKVREAWREIDDRRSALEAARARHQQELDETGVLDSSAEAVEQARAAAARLKALCAELDRAERALSQEIARLEERQQRCAERLHEAKAEAQAREREWLPAERLWERLRAQAEEGGLLTPALTTRLLDPHESRSHIDLRGLARKHAALLDERLKAARDGEEARAQISDLLSDQDQLMSNSYLQVWQVVRDWLRRRVPVQIAEMDDPLAALERLRQHLQVLGERLREQEQRLRGASEDVARGIDVHIRAAQRQVSLLNRELDGVRFGTIRSMRIRLTRDEQMEAVLRALRQGMAQEMLFTPSMPVEEALEALFTRYGGRGPVLGHRLLDYREYVNITVEIQRQASTQWERVNPSRLSTGEAIGVGTALMMVVLTAWERAANLLRSKRSLGTLRLLFLDEANRLSQDNLEVLFELCTALDLQLMIAAPEVARAYGCTTYRLVRRETPDGGEEVIVSGRKVVAGDADVGT